LFELAATKTSGYMSPSILYWRDFSAGYLAELCRMPESALSRDGEKPVDTVVEPPDRQQLEAMVSSVPPMRGAEYLSVDLLLDLWNDLDEWIRDKISASDE